VTDDVVSALHINEDLPSPNPGELLCQ